MSGAKEVTRDVHPRLFNVVEGMKTCRWCLPAMPKVYIIDTPAPNAFAVGGSLRKLLSLLLQACWLCSTGMNFKVW